VRTTDHLTRSTDHLTRSFRITEGTYHTDAFIEFLTEMRDHFDGDKVTLIWDGLPSHWSKKMKSWIATQRHWLRVEPLPPYAYDLNPIEQVWGNVKGTELANLCPDTIDTEVAAEAGLERVGSSYQLCFNFLAHTGLSLCRCLEMIISACWTRASVLAEVRAG
jgi:transposase